MPSNNPPAPADMRRYSSHSCHGYAEFSSTCGCCRHERQIDANQAARTVRYCSGWGPEPKLCRHEAEPGSTLCHGCQCLKAAEVNRMVDSIAGMSRIEPGEDDETD